MIVGCGDDEKKSDRVSIAGKIICATCDYNKRTLSDPDNDAMGVENGGKVYIVEKGKADYRELWNSRENGYQVELKGTIEKTDGKFVWVKPSSLKKLDSSENHGDGDGHDHKH